MIRLRDAHVELRQRVTRALQARESEVGARAFSLEGGIYLDEELFRREKQLLQTATRPLLALGEAPTQAGFFPLEGGYLVSCDSAGRLRVFANRCPHRGAKLVGEACRSQTTACPYHGWTFGVDGALRSIFGKQNGVEGSPGLKEFPSFSAGGFLWAGEAGPVKAALADLEDHGIETPALVDSFTLSGKFNWKIGVEAFLELYHFKMAHRNTLGSLPVYNVALFDFEGDVTRITVPMMTPWGVGLAGLKASCQFMHFVFPNQFFLVFEDHFGWLTVEPVGIAESRLHYRGLTLRREDRSSVRDKIGWSVAFLKGVMSEDVALCSSVQEVLREGDRCQLTRYEVALEAFHERLASA